MVDPVNGEITSNDLAGEDLVAMVKACERSVGPPPPPDVRTEAIERVYDRYLQTYQCMIDDGYPVDEPPTREVFVETFRSGDAWHPHDRILDTYPDLQVYEAQKSCSAHVD